jgi:DNA helicase-2/ATP-dependent DNA helicase PcrA
MSVYKPTDEQIAILDSDASTLVIAGPGSGKTATAIAAAKVWLSLNPHPSQVLFTSFSNAAVKRIAAAAGIDLTNFGRRVQFRTFHSLAMEVLRDFGRYVGLRRPAKALDRTEEHFIAAERGWDSGDEAAYRAVLKNLAKEEGFVAFQLMVPLAISLLRASPMIRLAVGARYQFIIVDEFQDTRADQWIFLKLIGENSRVLALGDPDQMIYEGQHQAVLKRVQDFAKWKGIEPTRFDGPNFRCNVSGINRFAEALLHGRKEVPTGKEGVQLFPAYPNQRRAALAAIWTAIRKQEGPKSNIAFIVPSSRTARQLAAELREPDPAKAIPVPIYARIETDEGALDAFRLAACAAADLIAAPNDQSLRTLAISLAVFAANWSRSKVTEGKVQKIAKRLSPRSRAASPLRDYLIGAMTGVVPSTFDEFAEKLMVVLEADPEFSSPGKAFRRHGLPALHGLSLKQPCLFDSYRKIRAAAGLEGTLPSRARTTLLSMYRSKGREFDFVVLVVEPRDHSQDVTIDELRRLYYVSATRARQWLGVLYVPGRPGPVLGPVIGE